MTLQAVTEVYNCSTKKTEIPYIRNSYSDTSYGYRASVKGKIKITTETKTFLVKT
ncbi:hypothetical protein [Clostridium sp.]|uniref:hypothetical protein n=1 Tax=Clostridium sp. TaxID=1506 RepID=UPI0025C43DD8|nr:hypothetical protein [Clostridium sp.]